MERVDLTEVLRPIATMGGAAGHGECTIYEKDVPLDRLMEVGEWMDERGFTFVPARACWQVPRSALGLD